MRCGDFAESSRTCRQNRVVRSLTAGPSGAPSRWCDRRRPRAPSRAGDGAADAPVEGSLPGSVLGFVWTFLNPLLLMAVYALVFRFYMRIAVPNYALFLLAGLLPWTWFSSSLGEGTNSIVGGSALVTKSLFPTEILPAVVVLSNMVNFAAQHPVVAARRLGCMASRSTRSLGCSWCRWSRSNAGSRWASCWRSRRSTCTTATCSTSSPTSCSLVLPHADRLPATQIPERCTRFCGPTRLRSSSTPTTPSSSRRPGRTWSAWHVLAYTLVSLLVGTKIFDGYRDTFPELV